MVQSFDYSDGLPGLVESLEVTMPNGCYVMVEDVNGESVIGAGGQNQVYAVEVYDRRGAALGGYVLKYAAQGSASSVNRTLWREELFMQRVERVSVEHCMPPGIPRALCYGETSDGEAFLLLERLTGDSLERCIQQGLGLQEALYITDRLLQTISMMETEETVVGEVGLETNALGAIIHMDIKPRNIYYDNRTNSVMLYDFGIAHGQWEEDDQPDIATGTAIWMAPEQCYGIKWEPRTNIFQVGLVMLEMLTNGGYSGGRLNSRQHNANDLELMMDIVTGRYMEIINNALDSVAGLTESLKSLIRIATAREPADRFSNAPAMRDALYAAGYNQKSQKKTDGIKPVFGDVKLRAASLIDEGSLPGWLRAR